MSKRLCLSRSVSSIPSRLITLCVLGVLASYILPAQNAQSEIIQRVDNAVRVRDEAVLSYAVTESYAMFRNHNEKSPVATMTVRTTYRKNQGKSYQILNETGSALLRKVLETLLDNERRLNEPANRVHALLTSANYEMTPKGPETVNGRSCIALDLKPRNVSPYLIRGTLWVDSQDGAIVQIAGTASKSPSIFTGNSQVSRQYALVDGYAMATHARAESNSWMVGQTIVTIDYTDYRMQLGPAH